MPVSQMCLSLQLSVTHVKVTHNVYVHFLQWDCPLLSPQSRPSTFCYAFLRRASCIGMWLTEAVFKPYVFLRGLLLLAGDIEQNPGPLQGRYRAASCQHSWMCKEHTCVVISRCGGRKRIRWYFLVDCTMQVLV